MAAPSEGQAFAAGVEKNWGAVIRSPEGTPQKIRQLIDEGIAPEEGGADAKDTSATFQSADGSPQAEQPSLESTSKEAFFSRCLTEEKISLLLHLLEDELSRRTDERKPTTKLGSDIQVHVTACILSVCGWACSSSLEPLQLSLITCSQCMRKVGLWGFQQIESTMTDLDASFGLTSSPIPGSEGRPERFPLVPESPRRMMTRSQDATFSPGSEQAEKSPGPIVSRTRSWDSSSPVDRPELETASPTTRTRPVTRSMGTGDTSGLEVPSSPLRKAKRARLCSSSSSDTFSRSFFDPISQHRDWCPWVNISLGKETRENGGTELAASTPAEAGWKAVLTVLLAHKQSHQPVETDSMSLSEKSRKVFRIFRQWESLCSP
ncbi:Nuclear-interacting partner of ALK [Tupaia chinensis]|uniref:Nuclear-interacting partner of ALK n=1 Tax=Tupaia chinensis TaxID=246437 RepID=L9JCM3_TUPCH|nr:Nuclear-interacting partner of ALK [Tupaia chinensis]